MIDGLVATFVNGFLLSRPAVLLLLARVSMIDAVVALFALGKPIAVPWKMGSPTRVIEILLDSCCHQLGAKRNARRKAGCWNQLRTYLRRLLQV